MVVIPQAVSTFMLKAYVLKQLISCHWNVPSLFHRSPISASNVPALIYCYSDQGTQ